MAAASAMQTASSVPAKIPDLPVCIVLALIYFSFAIVMIRRLLQSRKKFIVGGLLIGLCMSRVVTFSVRAAWSTHRTDRNLAIAAQVFVAAGIILLSAVNMQLLIRTVKSLRPEVQRSKIFTKATAGVQFFLIAIVIMTVVPAVQSLLARNPTIVARDRIVIKVSATYIAVYSDLPLLLAPLVYIFVRPSRRSIARLVWLRILLIMYVSVLLGLELTTKCANVYLPATVGKWYNTRTAFYLFTPLLELLNIAVLALIDLPHVFGDSNINVLDALNAESSGHDDDEDDVAVAWEQVEHALENTTTNYVKGRWTHVPSWTGKV